MNAGKIILNLAKFISCIAAVIIKKLSDSHAERIYRINEKFSREWRLLNSLTWSQEGHDFSIFLFVGFAFITAIFLISSCFDDRMRLSEKLMCTFGTVFYVLEGCLVFASLEYIPSELYTFAYILGSVSFLTAILLIVDLCIFGAMGLTAVKASQTEPCSLTQTFSKVGCHSRSPYRITSSNVSTTEDDFKKNYILNIDNKTPIRHSIPEKYLMTAV